MGPARALPSKILGGMELLITSLKFLKHLIKYRFLQCFPLFILLVFTGVAVYRPK